MNELYELPDGWEWKPLKDICKFENGDRGKNYPSKSAFVESGIAVVSATNLNGWDIDLSGLNYITEDKYNLIGGGKIKNGDILFCLRGSLGKCGLVKNFDKGVIASSLVIVRPTENLSTKLLLYYFNSNLVNEFINQYNNGAAQPNLSGKSLSLFDFPLPPLPEQQRIVSKLDLLFAKIDKSIELHQKNMDEANAFMGSVLNEVFGELEEKYNILKISDIAQIKGGKRLPKGEKLLEIETDYPYIRVADFLDNGTVNIETIQYITHEIYQQIKNYTITSNDLYISIAGTIGKTGIIPKELDGANLTENAAKLVYKREDILNKYIYFLTNSSKFEEQIGLATKTVAQPKLALSRLSEVELPLPPLSIQQKVVEYLNSVSEKMEKVKTIQKEKMDSLKALKASILDKAFRGEL